MATRGRGTAAAHHPGVPPRPPGLPTMTHSDFTAFELLSITPKPSVYWKKTMQASQLCSGWPYWDELSPSSHIRKLWKTWKLFQNFISKKKIKPMYPESWEKHLNLLLHSSPQQQFEEWPCHINSLISPVSSIAGVHFYSLQRTGDLKLLLLFHMQRDKKWENSTIKKPLQFLPVFSLKTREMSKQKSSTKTDVLSLASHLFEKWRNVLEL